MPQQHKTLGELLSTELDGSAKQAITSKHPSTTKYPHVAGVEQITLQTRIIISPIRWSSKSGGRIVFGKGHKKNS